MISKKNACEMEQNPIGIVWIVIISHNIADENLSLLKQCLNLAI